MQKRLSFWTLFDQNQMQYNLEKHELDTDSLEAVQSQDPFGTTTKYRMRIYGSIFIKKGISKIKLDVGRMNYDLFEVDRTAQLISLRPVPLNWSFEICF